jgi:hypothetical protein
MDSTTFNHVIELHNQKHTNTEDEEDITVLATALSATAAAQYYTMNFLKVPQHTSILGGRAWMEELLAGHSKRMRDNLGISQAGFQYLEQLLIEKGEPQSNSYLE